MGSTRILRPPGQSGERKWRLDAHFSPSILPAPMETDYKVRLEVFEGPLDLLLYLIKQDEIDIYDISIERITRQYLDYIEAFKMLDLDVAGDFLVMAANLIYIKSRSLLPVNQQPPEEDAAEEDPRWDLIRQLIEYKKFKDMALHLAEREQEQEKLIARLPEKPVFDAADPLSVGELGIFDLINAFQKVLKRIDRQEDLREIFEENFSVSDKIVHLQRVMAAGLPVRFTDLFAGAASRTEVVVTFLALLELIRMKVLRVIQPAAFDEIEIHKAPVVTPVLVPAG